MPPGLTLSVELKGDKAIEERFAKAGDSVRKAIVGVFYAVGQEIVAGARAGWPSSQGRATLSARIYDGSRGRGTGKIQLLVDNYPRTFRWVQQFEEGTVGTGDASAENATTGMSQQAHHGPWLRGVRGYTRHYSGRDVQGVIAGRQLKNRTNVKFGTTAMGFVRVHSYQREMQPMPVRPYMRPAFDAVKGTVLPRIEKAISAAMGNP